MAKSRKREHKRVSTAISVLLRSPDGRRETTEEICNISLGGVFIHMKDPFSFGTDIDLQFNLPQRSQVVKCKGFVVWSTKTSPERGDGRPGIGVRLMDIGVREMRLLNQFIEQEIKDS